MIGDGTSPQGEVPCRLGLLDVSCPSALTCYAVATAPGGYDTSPVSRTSAPGSSLWLTRNGGTTWTRQPIPAGVECNGDCSAQYGYPLEWVSCAPCGACPTAAGCYAVDNSNPFGDGSSTVSIYTATGQNGPGVTAPSGLFINDIACPAARTCYAVGDGGAILRTTNGTKFMPVKTSVRANLDGITCVTAADCFAVGVAGTIEALG